MVDSLKLSNIPQSIRGQYNVLSLDLNTQQMAKEVPKQYQRYEIFEYILLAHH